MAKIVPPNSRSTPGAASSAVAIRARLSPPAKRSPAFMNRRSPGAPQPAVHPVVNAPIRRAGPAVDQSLELANHCDRAIARPPSITIHSSGGRSCAATPCAVARRPAASSRLTVITEICRAWQNQRLGTARRALLADPGMGNKPAAAAGGPDHPSGVHDLAMYGPVRSIRRAFGAADDRFCKTVRTPHHGGAPAGGAGRVRDAAALSGLGGIPAALELIEDERGTLVLQRVPGRPLGNLELGLLRCAGDAAADLVWSPPRGAP